MYQDVGFESLQVCCWLRKLCLFYEILNDEHWQYPFKLIPFRRTFYSTRNALNIPLLNINHNFVKKLFFPCTIIKWNKLDRDLRKADSLLVFKTYILKFKRPSPNPAYNYHNPKGLKIINRIKLGFSHLRKHKFKQSFQSTSFYVLSPICN